MGHLIFCILHLLAFMFGFIGLVITLPLHMIYSAVKQPRGLRADGKPKNGGLFGWVIDDIAVARNTKTCPFCAEKILKKAITCKHCGKDLPAEDDRQETKIQQDVNAKPQISWINLAIIIAAALVLFFLFVPISPL